MANSIGEYGRLWLKQIRSGESGALPVIIGLIVIVIFFQVKSSAFLSAGNLVNLMTQSAFIITLGMAEVFVLLLGEIDLAAGYTAACGAVIALWMVATGWPWWVAILATLAATGIYGAVHGGVIRLNNNVLNDIEGGALSAAGSWIVTIVLVVLAGTMMYLRDHRRRVNG